MTGGRRTFPNWRPHVPTGIRPPISTNSHAIWKRLHPSTSGPVRKLARTIGGLSGGRWDPAGLLARFVTHSCRLTSGSAPHGQGGPTFELRP
jgi:hypothetical protein